MTEGIVSKRVMVTLPDSISADLEAWADEEGRPTANLAAFLVEQAVRAKFPEKYPVVRPK
jgi:CopG-like RHH_1 or ribbon-helix-helix domain, RHH_5